MVQKFAEAIGENGCYFLCLLKHFGKEYDALRWYEKLAGPLADKSVMGEDCYIKDPARLAGFLSGSRWSVRVEAPEYKVQPGEWEVLRYERKDTMKTWAHFCLPEWDPLGDSRTRLQGKLASKRIFKEVV